MPTVAAPSPPARIFAVLEWILVVSLAATVAGTTLALGGYRASTLALLSWGIFGCGALGGILLLRLDATGRGRFNRALLLPLPFLLYALASVLWLAPAPWLAWREWLLWFQMWLVFVLVLHFGRSRAQTCVLAGTLLALALTAVGMAAYQRFVDHRWMMLGQTQVTQYLGRSAGMFSAPNSLAGLLVLVVPVCLTLLTSRQLKPGGKVLAGWFAGLLLVAVGLTVSRGGWLSLGCALLLWPVLALRTWTRKALGLAGALLVVVAVVWGVNRYSAHARERLEPLLAGQVELTRPLMWRAGIELWRTSPWVGTGAASYNVLFDQHRARGFLTEPLWTHNDYLNTLSDYGVVGLILWIGAGAAVLAIGWLAIARSRRDPMLAKSFFLRAKWKLGLWLGLLAFALHLGVEFHTKIPALTFAVAIVGALVIRDEPRLMGTVSRGGTLLAGLALVLVCAGLGARVAWPLYRAEGMRFEARRQIDRHAVTGQGDLLGIAREAKRTLRQAVRIDPTNGQAWSDLAYATTLTWRKGDDRGAIGFLGELAANEALRRCDVNAGFWVVKAEALDLQHGRDEEAETCFRRALALAPSRADWWYRYGLHLRIFPERREDARRALATCLALDPYYPGAESLRQQLQPAAN